MTMVAGQAAGAGREGCGRLTRFDRSGPPANRGEFASEKNPTLRDPWHSLQNVRSLLGTINRGSDGLERQMCDSATIEA
jgi:hypothetical protein